jgi:hypothetical protein
MKDYNFFRLPYLVEKNGLYVTLAQLNFFMNREHGEHLIATASPEFVKYYKNCYLYNLVYDMMEEDPDCALMYWDPDNETVAISFPVDGKVAQKLEQAVFGSLPDDL